MFCSTRCYDKFQNHKTEVKCNKCGNEIKKSPSHMNVHRHHFCDVECFSKFYFKDSFVETEFENLIKNLGLKYDRNNRKKIRPLELDFYFPEISFAVEVNGRCHYDPIYGQKALKGQKERDRKKRKKCKDLGIKLRTVKPGNCKRETYLPRYKRVIWEIQKEAKYQRNG